MSTEIVGAPTQDRIARFNELWEKAWDLFYHYIGNNNGLDEIVYPDKEYGWLCDELDDITIGYLKEEPDGDYQQRLKDEGFTLTLEEAIAVLEHRVESINECLNQE
jgi:hypothetical protein